MNQPSESRIVLAKILAQKWLRQEATPEYRMDILFGFDAKKAKMLPSLLRAFRDGRVRLSSTAQISDLGIQEDGESLQVWSSNHQGMKDLQTWLEKQGYETSGMW